MFHNLKGEYARIAAVLASVLILILAVKDIATTAENARFIALDSFLESGEPVSARAVSEAAGRLSVPPDTCRTDLWDSVLDVEMQNIEQKERATDRRPWIAALNSAEPLLRGALRCMPTNSLVWARLAYVRWALGGGVDEQAYLLTMSQACSPAEIRAVRARMGQWVQVSVKVLEIGNEALRKDIRAILNHAPLSIAKELLATIPSSLAQTVAEEARGLGESRYSSLVLPK